LQALAHPGEFLALLGERLLGFRQRRLARAFENAPALGIDALPIGALRLDPVAARAARITRAASFADDAFEVFGKRGDHPAAAGQFVAAVADLHAVGQTFGGMFAGHGVFAVDGPSRFTLESYEIA
jgi:hypothetical protein